MFINKVKYVKKYVGEVLEKEGFRYAGKQGGVWIFEKETENAVQNVGIFLYRFDRSMVSFQIFTDKDPLPTIALAMDEGIGGNCEMPGFWKFEDQATFIDALKEITEIVMDKGLKILDEMSKPTPKPKIGYHENDMYIKLRDEHEMLARNYIEKTGILSTGFDRENIDRWVEHICNEVDNLHDEEDLDKVKDKLIELAAFLGEQIVKYTRSEWFWDETEENKEIGIMKPILDFCIEYKEMPINALRFYGPLYQLLNLYNYSTKEKFRKELYTVLKEVDLR